MALVVITLTDNEGEVNVAFQSEPAFTPVIGGHNTPAQTAAQVMLNSLQVYLQRQANRAPSGIVIPN